MGVNRKFQEPVVVYDAYGRPTPAPVLTNEHVADAGARLITMSKDALVAGEAVTYAPLGMRPFASFFGTFYNRVHVIPRIMALVDPDEGVANTFYLWNAFLGSVELTDIISADDEGLVLSFTAGLVLADLELKEVSVIVTPAAPVAAVADYQFFFDNGSVSPFTIDLLRTNLLLVSPETPIRETLSWKTDVLTARDGSEQRFGLRQIARQVLTYKVIYEDTRQERAVYEQLFARGNEAFSVPLWHEPMKLFADAVIDATQVLIDTLRYDVRAEDQIYIEHSDGTYEIVRVQQVQPDGLTVVLYGALLGNVSKLQRIYRVTTVNLPSKPALRRGAYQHLESNLELRVITDRDIFVGDAVPVEIGQGTQLRDRIITSAVYTLGGVPIVHARPLVVSGALEESFDWNFEIVDYETGPVEQITSYDFAKVTYDRTFHTKYPHQRFFISYLLNYMHGQRKPVWLPTWQDELTPRIASLVGNIMTITDEQFANDFPANTSHRGIWIRWTAGWLARRIVAVSKDGDGNSIVEIEPALPLDFPASPPYQVGHLVLARLGSDEVEIEHRAAYSLHSMSFTSTKTTDEGV